MLNKLSQKISQLYLSDKLPWIIICFGIILRLVRYMHNPSLYFDEAGSAVDIIARPIHDLSNPSPDATSTYPVTFLILTKLAIQLFGNSEYALRLFPLLFGISSLLLFYYVAKHYINPKAVPAALLLFAVSDSLVYYSSILKPYSGDVFFALLIYASLIKYQSQKNNILKVFSFVLLGAAIIWLSNSSIFVLAGIGTVMLISSFTRKEWSKTIVLSSIFLIWFLNFIVYYFFFIKNATTTIGADVESILAKEGALFPFPPKSIADIKWFIDTFFSTFNFVDQFDFSQGFTLIGIAALLFLAGCISMYSRNKEKFLTLTSPLFFTLAAAALHLYSFRGRLILFLTPIFFLLIADGVNYIYEKTKDNAKAITFIIIIFLFIYPVSWAAYHAKKPFSREEIKPTLQYIKENWKNGDILYVHFYAQYAFEYYVKHHPKAYLFDDDEYIIGIAPRGWYRIWRRQDVSKYYDTEKIITQSSIDIFNEYERDLVKAKKYQRFWVLTVSNISSIRGIKDYAFINYQLNKQGMELVSSLQLGTSSAYLYNQNMQPSSIQQ